MQRHDLRASFVLEGKWELDQQIGCRVMYVRKLFGRELHIWHGHGVEMVRYMYGREGREERMLSRSAVSCS